MSKFITIILKMQAPKNVLRATNFIIKHHNFSHNIKNRKIKKNLLFIQSISAVLNLNQNRNRIHYIQICLTEKSQNFFKFLKNQ